MDVQTSGSHSGALSSLYGALLDHPQHPYHALSESIAHAVFLGNCSLTQNPRTRAAQIMEAVSTGTLNGSNNWLEISHVEKDYAEFQNALQQVVQRAMAYVGWLQTLPTAEFVPTTLSQVPILAGLVNQCQKHMKDYQSLEDELRRFRQNADGIGLDLLRVMVLTGLKPMKLGFINQVPADHEFQRVLRFFPARRGAYIRRLVHTRHSRCSSDHQCSF